METTTIPDGTIRVVGEGPAANAAHALLRRAGLQITGKGYMPVSELREDESRTVNYSGQAPASNDNGQEPVLEMPALNFSKPVEKKSKQEPVANADDGEVLSLPSWK